MSLGDMLVGMAEARNAARANQANSLAERFELGGYYGPAAYCYGLAWDEARMANASGITLQALECKCDECRQRAREQGQQNSRAPQVTLAEIERSPELFAHWFVGYQRGELPGWQKFLWQRDEQERKERAEREEEEKRKERQKRWKKKSRNLEGMRKTSPERFAQRWEQLLAAAADLANGDEQAMTRAVSLWKRPKNKESWWGAAWSRFAQGALLCSVAEPSTDTFQKARAAFPKIAMKAEGWDIVPQFRSLGFFCLAYPVCLLVTSGGGLFLSLWSEDCGLFMSLLWLCCFLVILPFAVAGWVLRYATIPAGLVWLYYLIRHRLPVHRWARGIVETGDVKQLLGKCKFRRERGAPLN